MIEEKLIKDAQYRKSLNIAFFNATNSAISLVSTILSKTKIEEISNDEMVEKMISEWRNWFLEEYNNYYARVIENVGSPYNLSETIEKLNSAKTLLELKEIWHNLSPDERKNEEVTKVTRELKTILK